MDHMLHFIFREGVWAPLLGRLVVYRQPTIAPKRMYRRACSREHASLPQSFPQMQDVQCSEIRSLLAPPLGSGFANLDIAAL